MIVKLKSFSALLVQAEYRPWSIELEYLVAFTKKQDVFRAFLRVFYVVFTAIFIFASISAPVQAAVKRAYAGIVVDAKSGKVLYSRAADAKRYPASITKVMTLYIVFQELEAGRLNLSTRMKVSKYAANAVPSKLGLRAGTTISVENAIKALVTKSANDVARVIAEHISGSESKFAERMTRVARALGMKRTTYRNASGLPNSKQITTVRDQSRLGMAIFQHFPKYYKYFQTRTFRYKGKTYGNNNRLLGQNGIDGIKTGYIRASGFNLLTAARKNNRHIIVVAFGFDSGTQRNAKVAALVNSYLKKARRGSIVAQARITKPRLNGSIRVAVRPVTPMPRLASRMNIRTNTISVASNKQALPSIELFAPVPAPRPINLLNDKKPSNVLMAYTSPNLPANNTQTPPIQMQTDENSQPIDIIGAWISERLEIEDNNSEIIMLPPVEIGSGSQTIDLMTSGSINKTAKSTKNPEEDNRGWLVQVGSANSNKEAQALIASAANYYAPLKNMRPIIEQSNKSGATIFRAKIVGFGNFNQAKNACNQLRKKQVMCLTMKS